MSEYDEHKTRRFNRRLISIAFSIFLLTAFITAALFEWTSRKRLDAAIQSWRKAGQPVVFEDFFEPFDLSDSENAAVALRSAENHFDKTGNPLDADTFDFSVPLPAGELQQVNAFLARNQPTLADLRAAAQLKRAQWHTPPISWLNIQKLNPFGNQRSLIDLLGLQALAHLSTGDESAAADDLTEALRLVDHIGRIEPTLVDFLVATGCRALVSDRCERWMTADIHATTRPATAAQRQTLIAQLLDESVIRREWHDALIGERAMELHQLQQFIYKSYFPPMERQRLLRFLNKTTQLAELDITSHWPTVSAQARQLTTPEPGVRSTMSLLTEILQPSFQMTPKTGFRCIADRRLVAIGLAIRWYRADHSGTLPPTLDALIPVYLPWLPDDPFAASPQPFHYPPAATQPCIYSVGENGTDDGGSTKLLPRERPMTEFFRWQDEDAVLFLLHPPPPQTKPSESPAQN